MPSTRGWASLLTVAGGVALLPDAAHADRRTSLGGNILIEDPDDLFPFPQYTLKHRNMIRLDYGATSTANNAGGDAAGNGVLTLGNDEHAFGVAVHRGDLLTPDVVGFNQELAWLSGVEGVNPFGNAANAGFPGPEAVDADAGLVLPATVMDLSYATSLGSNPFGIRLGFGRGVQALKNDDDEVTKGAQTFFAAQLGYSSLPATGLRWDGSANAVFAFGKATDDDIEQNSGWNLRLGALGRAYYPINELVDIGMIGNLSLDNEHTEDGAPSDKSNDFAFGLMAALGPSIHLERAKLGAYGGFRMRVGKLEPNGNVEDDEVNRLRFAAPLVNLAVEVQVLDWLFVRTGAEYAWELRRDGSEGEKQRVADSAFRWSAGLGMAKAGFSFDGVITNELMTSGPNFIGGATPGFLAMASMTYKFGDVFGPAHREVLAAPTPAGAEPEPSLAAPPPPLAAPPPLPPPSAAAPPTTAEPAPDQELAPPQIEPRGTRRGSAGVNAAGKRTVGE